jgi:hypothetical protein
VNDQERKDGHGTSSADNKDAIGHAHVLDSAGREYSDSGTAPESKRQKIKNYCNQLLAEKPDRHIELALTLAISFFAAVQLMVTCSNNSSTSDQAEKMILITQRNERAANKIADASRRNAVAAESFSTSAEHINQGVGDAVGKLNLQAGELAKNATQASRLASAAIQGNQLSKDAIEAQLGANRPILEIENLGGPQTTNIATGPNPITGLILHKDATTFQFRLKNTGPGEAQNVRYAISQPYGIRSDYGISYIRQSIEMAIEGGSQLGGNPIIGKIPNIFGHANSDAIPVNAKSLISLGGAPMYDSGEFFYGELDWDDIIGFGHHWTRKFCFLVVVRDRGGESIADCGVKQERVYARDDSQKKNTKRQPSHQ